MNQELLQKYITGEITQEEKKEVIEWLDADQQNMKEYKAMRRTFDISVWHEDASDISDSSDSSDKKDAPSATDRPERSLYKRLILPILKTAAIFIVAFFSAYQLLGYLHPGSANAEMQTIFVPAGQRAELTLADGTKVWLNAKTSFTFPTNFAADNRQVVLDGEGYFDVVTDRNRPFIVRTEAHDVKVFGTEFNVLAYKGKELFETDLLEGSVEVVARKNAAKVVLKPGNKVFLSEGLLKTGRIEHENYFLWKEGILSFNDEPVESMMRKLELYYDVKIIVCNPSFLHKHYTGKFRTKDGVEHVLRVLQLKEHFTYTKDDEQNLITIQ